MAKSLENVGNEFEITNDENTTTAEKNESMVHMIGVMANFVQFWLWNPNRRSLRHQQIQKYWIAYAVHTTGVFTKFMESIHSLVAMATSLENLGNEFEIANHEITTMAEKNYLFIYLFIQCINPHQQ